MGSTWRDETVELARSTASFLCRPYGRAVNIVHVTSPAGVRWQRAPEGAEPAETCPHYLYLTDKDIEERGAPSPARHLMRLTYARDGMKRLLEAGDIFTGSDHGGRPGAEAAATTMFAANQNAGERDDGRAAAQLSHPERCPCNGSPRMAKAVLYGSSARRVRAGSDGDFTSCRSGRRGPSETLIGKADS